MIRPRHRLFWLSCLLWAAALCGSGCGKGFFGGGDEEPARYARIVLTPDERLNSASELTALLRRVELTFDSPTGFAGVDVAGQTLGSLEAIQADGDEPLELLARFELSEPTSLPVVLLTPGQNGDRPIGISARGFDGTGAPVAFGQALPRLLFPGDKEELVSVPFNLTREDLRPPSLIGLAPAAMRSGTLRAAAFYLSKPVSRPALEGKVALALVDSEGRESPVPATLGEPRDCPFGKQMWTLVPDGCHTLPQGPLRLKLTIGADVLDERGFAVRDPEGKPGVSYLGPELSIRTLGPCPADGSCADALPVDANQIDLICHSGSGTWEAASCSLAPAGCLGPYHEFAWVQAADHAACTAIRADTLWIDGKNQCAIIEPTVFFCNDHAECNAIFSDKCIGKACSAIPEVNGECPDKSWVLTPTKGCRPRIGGCQEDCAATSTCAPDAP